MQPSKLNERVYKAWQTGFVKVQSGLIFFRHRIVLVTTTSNCTCYLSSCIPGSPGPQL